MVLAVTCVAAVHEFPGWNSTVLSAQCTLDSGVFIVKTNAMCRLGHGRYMFTEVLSVTWPLTLCVMVKMSIGVVS